MTIHSNVDVDSVSNLNLVQNPILPVAEPQCPKFTSYGSSRKSNREINHSKRSPLQKPNKPLCDLTPGYIYAFESPVYAPSHIKVGQSSRAPETRMREWQKCGIPLSIVAESTPIIASSSRLSRGKDAFYHYTLVESLVFEEFHDQRQWFECKICKNSQRGPQRHIEWLEVDDSTITHAKDHWRSWSEGETPCTSSGRLTVGIIM